MAEPRTEATLRAQITTLAAFLRAWWAGQDDDYLAGLAPGGSILRFQPGHPARGNARFCDDVARRLGKLSAHLVNEGPRALQRLPADERDALHVLYGVELQGQAAAVRLGCHRKTVVRRAGRGLVRLARALWDDAGHARGG